MPKIVRRFRSRYHTAFLIMKLLLPVFLTILALLLLASGAVFYAIIHPERSLEVIAPSDYYMYASDFTWEGANDDVMQGYYIRGSNQAPLIILCHGYDTNRTEVLSLASRFKDYGYNVFVYNSRGHGKSGYSFSSLGLLEAEDLRRAIQKLVQRPEIDFQRIGLYGVSLGAYTALAASKGDLNVKILVVDSIYTSIAKFIELKVNRILGFRTALMTSLVELFYYAYFGVSPDSVSEEFPIDGFTDKRILFVTGSDILSAELAKQTRRLYTDLICNKKEILNLPSSREAILYGEEKYQYDLEILDFFKRHLPLVEVAPENELENNSR